MNVTRVSLLGIGALCVNGIAVGHHSRALYDMSAEVVIEGTVARLNWSNPHIFLTVRTAGPNGALALQEIEVTSVSEALAMGLDRDAIAPGSEVVVRAHPGRGGQGSRAVGIDVRTSDGRLLPLNTGADFAVTPSSVVEAEGIEGRWAPSVTEFNATFREMGQWPFTESARASMQGVRAAPTAVIGICVDYPPPMLSVFPDLREITVRDTSVEIHFEAQGQNILRIVHLNQTAHPANVAPTLLGHSIGRWEQQTLVIDTVAFEPNFAGIMAGVASGPGKHLLERLTLTQDRRHLRYEVTLDDPAGLTAPASLDVLWEYRPDLEPSGVSCDSEAAREILQP